MRAEKRKAYLIAFMVAVLLLSVPLTYLRVLLASGRISGRTAADITGCYGIYCDRLGGELAVGGNEIPAVMGNLIGFNGVIENALSEQYGALLGPRGFHPLTGLKSLENQRGGALHTTLLPLTSQQRIADSVSIDGNAYHGAVFAYNYVTGEVYTTLSLPSQGYYTEDASDGVYFNKVVNGTYTPGSTMKVAAVLCALQQEIDLSDFTYDCCGYLELADGKTIWCTYPHGYGLTVEDALGLSCNCFIAKMASAFDVEQTREIMGKMGFYSPEEPTCERRLDAFSRSTSEMSFDTNDSFQDLWGMAGQGNTAASPVDMAMIAGAVAAEGRVAIPYLAQQVQDRDTGRTLYAVKRVETERLFPKETARQARELWKTGYETYYSTDIGAVTYMKTGTAECVGGQINRTLLGVLEKYDTAFFICVEDVWSGCDVCFDVLDVLVEELTACLEKSA